MGVRPLGDKGDMKQNGQNNAICWISCLFFNMVYPGTDGRLTTAILTACKSAIKAKMQ